MLQHLPEEALLQVTFHLIAPDVLRLLCTHPSFKRLGFSAPFWQSLKAVQYPNLSVRATHQQHCERIAAEESWDHAKNSYMLKAYCDMLPSARWYQMQESRNTPSDREGHSACRLGNYLVVTGGFTQDSVVYLKNIEDGLDWTCVRPDATVQSPVWAYGSSLTALDDTRAVRFGGFCAGGYAAETSQVAILSISFNSTNKVMARWEIIECRFLNGDSILSQDRTSNLSRRIARAYHATVLLRKRYLVVVGGMQEGESVLDPLLLDTLTWTWYADRLTTEYNHEHGTRPSCTPRHGCSLIHDHKRERLLLFGGGDGNDLLRSGEDFSQVWMLDMKKKSKEQTKVEKINTTTSSDDILCTFPWGWSILYDTNMENNNTVGPSGRLLSDTEKLNLGRCHGCYRIGNDTCLLAFGSGRPSTNSILGYRMDRNEFFRPRLQGALPKDRFTFASVYLEDLGYLFVHGGYSSQSSETISNVCVLDLAPSMQRPFRMWPVDRGAISQPAVTSDDVVRPRFRDNAIHYERITGLLLETEPNERPETAALLLAELAARRQLDVQTATFLRMVAMGHAQFTDEDILTDGESETEEMDDGE